MRWIAAAWLLSNLAGCAVPMIRAGSERSVEDVRLSESPPLPQAVSRSELVGAPEAHAAFVGPSTRADRFAVPSQYVHALEVRVPAALLLESNDPPESGELAGIWFRSVDEGVRWIPSAPPERKDDEFLFRFEKDGRYCIRYVPLPEGPIRGLLTPPSGAPGQLVIVVDRQAPQLEWIGHEADGKSFPGVVLRWSARDANLGERPVRIEYRIEGQAVWTPLVEDLPNTGRYEWGSPPVAARSMRFRVIVRDLSGLSASVVTGLVQVRVKSDRWDTEATPSVLSE